MSHVSQFTIQRNGTTIAQHLNARVEEASPMLASDVQGASPYNLFNIYFRNVNPDVRRGDYVLDEQEINPLTQQPVRYLVRGRPEKYPSGTQIIGIELIEEVVDGE